MQEPYLHDDPRFLLQHGSLLLNPTLPNGFSTELLISIGAVPVGVHALSCNSIRVNPWPEIQW